MTYRARLHLGSFGSGLVISASVFLAGHAGQSDAGPADHASTVPHPMAQGHPWLSDSGSRTSIHRAVVSSRAMTAACSSFFVPTLPVFLARRLVTGFWGILSVSGVCRNGTAESKTIQRRNHAIVGVVRVDRRSSQDRDTALSLLRPRR